MTDQSCFCGSCTKKRCDHKNLAAQYDIVVKKNKLLQKDFNNISKNKILEKIVSLFAEHLSPREYEVLQLRQTRTLKQCAECLGVGPERIRQIESRALGKIRRRVYWFGKITKLLQENEALLEKNRILEEALIRYQKTTSIVESEYFELLSYHKLGYINTRLYNSLRRAGCRCVTDIKIKLDKISNCDGFGRKSMEELKEFLERIEVSDAKEIF